MKIKHTTYGTRQYKNSGFAILFAVLAASLLLSIGLSIFSLTIKELALSSSGRESEYAFYAADSGAECAHYWDTLSTESISPFENDSATPAPACGGSTLSFTQTPGSATTTTFDMNVYAVSPNYYCSVVTVTKTSSGTTIDSRGYNICPSSSPSTPDYGNQNLVERGLELNY
ncbi:MAG TPA: hypothetical protein VMR73_01610 [Candidatus Paceibacterota bacterium]|nr:hypothetical protein [Candidatus Paceibacterota bacterium]